MKFFTWFSYVAYASGARFGETVSSSHRWRNCPTVGTLVTTGPGAAFRVSSPRRPWTTCGYTDSLRAVSIGGRWRRSLIVCFGERRPHTVGAPPTAFCVALG